MKNLLLLSACLIIFSPFILCQKAFPVYIENNADDEVGKTLVYKLKEELRKSNSFDLKLVEDGQAKFVFDITTLDKNKGDSKLENLAPVYSIVILIDNGNEYTVMRYNFITNLMGFTGIKNLDRTAINIAANTLDILTNVIELLQKNK